MFQVPAPPVPPTPPPLPEIIVGGGPEALIVSLIAACVMAGFVLFGPVGRAIADGIRHILGSRRRPDTAEVAATREEVAALQRRVAEIEERQDFAERLLAQARERGLLSAPPPK